MGRERDSVGSFAVLSLGIIGSTVLGVAARIWWPQAAQSGSDRTIAVSLWVILPPCVFVNVAHFDLASGAGAGLALGLASLAAGGILAWYLAVRVAHLPDRTAGASICAAIIANTGYYGLPATLILFGSDAVTRAAAWDAILTGPVTFVAGFAVGAVFGRDGGGEPDAGARLRSFFTRNPVLWVLVPALLTPASAIPDWALDASHLAFTVLLPVGFLVLGVNLYEPGGFAHVRSLAIPVAIGTAVRLLLVPALYLGLCAAVGGIPGSYVIQAAAPTGISALIVAATFDLDRQVTAATIAATTGFAVLGVLLSGAL